MFKNSIPIIMILKDLPVMFGEFISMVSNSSFQGNPFPVKHRFHEVINFYLNNKNQDWESIKIPGYVLKAADEIAHFVIVLKQVVTDAHNGKSAKCLLEVGMIDSYCAEALIISNYVRRGYLIQWLSIFKVDPPDVRIYCPTNKIDVDIEVKAKIKRPTIQGVFDSVSKGLSSLKNRCEGLTNPAIIAIHSPIDLGWKEWLNNPEVLMRLKGRLEHSDYQIVSGLIFSGGHIEENDNFGGSLFKTQLIGIRSHVAKYPLPKGFLTDSTDI